MNQKKKIDENIIINDFLKKLNFSKKETFNFENDAAILKAPTNKEIVINDRNDQIFRTDKEKYNAIVKKIEETIYLN